ncbi:MAG: pentapeptide repeat-containing protein [Candidatus Limnocylindrales bacterium]
MLGRRLGQLCLHLRPGHPHGRATGRIDGQRRECGGRPIRCHRWKRSGRRIDVRSGDERWHNFGGAIERPADNRLPPGGFQLATSPTYYDITTTAIYADSITVCLPYDPIAYPDPSLVQLLHWNGTSWDDVTSSLDTTDNLVCGTTTSLSPFVVGQLLQQAQSITFGPLVGAVYGAGPITLTATASSGLPVSYAAAGSCTVSGSTLTIMGVGKCTVTALQAGTATWAAASPVSQSFTTTQASLIVTAPSPSRAYGSANPIFTPIYAGFVAGDTAASLTTAPTCVTTATAASPVGTYPITCSGAVDPNYSFTYSAGTLSVVIVDRYWTTSGVPLTVAAPGFLALTSVGNSSVVVSQAPKGKLTLGATPGAFTYVPPAGWTGTDSFKYQLKTGSALSSPVTVTIYVLGSGINCTGCNLSGLQIGAVSLTGSNLSKANLTGTGLAHANLTGVNLSGTTLTSASLSSANLTGANLSGATLTSASLSSANLTGANLSNANLTGANLTGATLTGVAWSGATCPDGAAAKSHGNTCVGHLSPLVLSPSSRLATVALAVDIKEPDPILLAV